MPIFTKESLELLRGRIDLVDVLSSHVDLKRAGNAYKALCPFHEEKSPSFQVQRGDHHYHCFGCGAHGDAIAFLMQHLRLSFSEAVEHLAERFHVPLETEDASKGKGPGKGQLKEALLQACRFYHFCLLHTKEGQEALRYLFARGLDLDFIRHFQVGYAPRASGALRKVLHRYPDEILREAGLLAREGDRREFFFDRVTFPIRDATGACIGFSARKIKETTFGGKYVNTPETLLFKKSYTLFGLNYSRKRIAKERRAIVVEGQIDALRMIQEGFNFTVAGQGTAFGDGHVKALLQLGVTEVWLAFDADLAGKEAAVKVGDLFQRLGIEVYIVSLPPGEDPDTLLSKQGPSGMLRLLEEKSDYLTFLVEHASRQFDASSPAGKTQMIGALVTRIKEWDNALMVHESLKRLARLMEIPEEMVGLEAVFRPAQFMKRAATAGPAAVDPDRILEMDLLRWLVLLGQDQPALVELALHNIDSRHFHTAVCKEFFDTFKTAFARKEPLDLLSLAIHFDQSASQELLSDLMQKKVKVERAREHLVETVQKLLDRKWMQEREEVKRKIQSGQCTDEQALELARQFDLLKRAPPCVTYPA